MPQKMSVVCIPRFASWWMSGHSRRSSTALSCAIHWMFIGVGVVGVRDTQTGSDVILGIMEHGSMYSGNVLGHTKRPGTESGQVWGNSVLTPSHGLGGVSNVANM